MKLLALLSLFLVASCGSVFNLKMTTNPDGATILARNIGSKKTVEIGKTPYISSMEELKAKNFADGPMIFEFTKEGYQPTQLYVTEITADIEFTVEMDKLDKLAATKRFDQVGTELFEIHRLVRNKKYKDAYKLLDKIKKEFPTLSIVHELEGSILYLEKKLNKSLDAFRIAYRHNDENLFALQMRTFLEKKLKIKNKERTTAARK